MRALYDFEGDTANGELCIKEGDSIEVLNKVSAERGREGVCVSITSCYPLSFVFIRDADKT